MYIYIYNITTRKNILDHGASTLKDIPQTSSDQAYTCMLHQCAAASTPSDAGVIALTSFQDAFDWSTGVTTEKPKVVKVRASQIL